MKYLIATTTTISGILIAHAFGVIGGLVIGAFALSLGIAVLYGGADGMEETPYK